MTRATDLAPLTPQDVGAMGLVLEDQECPQQHVAGQKPHRHMTLPATTAEYRTHACPDCGHVHLSPDTGEGSAS